MRHLRRPDLLTRTLDGEVVILDRSKGLVHQLNSTASHVWNACDGERSASEIAADLAKRFVDVPDTVLTDVRHTIAELERLELLVKE